MVGQAHEAHAMVAAADQDPIFWPHVATGAAIHHHHQPLWRGRKHGDRFAVTEYQGPGGQGMGRDRRELQHRAVGCDHRAAGAEGVGGGAGGGGEDHPIGGDIDRGVAADGDLEMAHARERFPVQGHLVEAEHLPAPLFAPHHAHHQHGALFHGPVAGNHLVEGLVQFG